MAEGGCAVKLVAEDKVGSVSGSYCRRSLPWSPAPTGPQADDAAEMRGDAPPPTAPLAASSSSLFGGGGGEFFELAPSPLVFLPLLLIQGSGMDLSRVGKKLLSSVRSVCSLGLLPVLFPPRGSLSPLPPFVTRFRVLMLRPIDKHVAAR